MPHATEAAVRERAAAFGAALVAGDIDRAITDLSDELHRNLGEVLALFPLPATEASVESIGLAGSGYNVVLRLVGEGQEVQVATRWKDRDGAPRIIEASHLSRATVAEQATEAEQAGATVDTEVTAASG
jgi:hypothetical protein